MDADALIEAAENIGMPEEVIAHLKKWKDLLAAEYDVVTA